MATLEQVIEGEPTELETEERVGEATDEPREGTEVREGEQATLVDPSEYDDPELAIAKVDGNSIDRIALKFSGTVYLDRSDAADVKLYNALKLGRDVTIMVEGKCLGTAGKGATNREGELDVVVGEKTVKVTTVYRPAAEDLERELERSGTPANDDAEADS